jgi:hypothetical protein
MTAIEHEPDLSVTIGEAPGDRDQALAHASGPEGFLVGSRVAWGSVGAASLLSKRGTMENVISVNQPDPRSGEWLELIEVMLIDVMPVEVMPVEVVGISVVASTILRREIAAPISVALGLRMRAGC